MRLSLVMAWMTALAAGLYGGGVLAWDPSPNPPVNCTADLDGVQLELLRATQRRALRAPVGTVPAQLFLLGDKWGCGRVRFAIDAEGVPRDLAVELVLADLRVAYVVVELVRGMRFRPGFVGVGDEGVYVVNLTGVGVDVRGGVGDWGGWGFLP